MPTYEEIKLAKFLAIEQVLKERFGEDLPYGVARGGDDWYYCMELLKQVLKLTGTSLDRDYWKFLGFRNYLVGILWNLLGKRKDAIKAFKEAIESHDLDDKRKSEVRIRLKELEEMKEGGCFIATAVYGTPFASEVIILKSFRDEILSKSRIGKFLIACYYRFSLFFAPLITQSELLKKVIRICIIEHLIKISYNIWLKEKDKSRK